MTAQGKKYFLSFFLLAGVLCTFAAGFKHPVSESFIRFTENKGQWDSKIMFRSDLDGGALFMEENAFTYHFYDKETLRKNHIRSHEGSIGNEKIASSAFRMSFVNSLKPTEIQAKNITPDHCNYFIGKDKSKWQGNVRNYKEVYYKNLYSGIDLQVLGMENSLKYNFIVAANSPTDVIQLQYQGVKEIRISKGSLHISTGINDIMEEKPVAYQIINGKHVDVPCRFVLKKQTVSFDFPKGYDKSQELIIDPILVFACTSGSVADNFGMTATYDDAGNLYAGGTVYGVGYPTVNAFDSTWNGSPVHHGLTTDVVITKYDATGTVLQYSTYLGGWLGTEIVSSLIVNQQNELMLFGATGSSDFPVTASAYDTLFSGGTNIAFWANGTGYTDGTDLYLAKFSSSGSSLIASTYVGGTRNEGTNNSSTLVYNYGDYYRGEIQVDTANNFYVASCTESPDFPVTGGCAQPMLGGGLDGVIFKMSPDLSTMLWSTYIGGSADDGCYALTLDNFQNIYTTGGTSSTNFPVTPGTFSTVYNGGITDGFITKLQNNGAAILNSTFVGTPLYDQAFLIQLDNFFDVYIVGQSLGSMPVTAGAYSNPNSKQFIWKMNGNLSTPLITTIFGNGNGQVNISPSAFLVDICGNIYVSGWGGHILNLTPTFGMPLTPDAYQTSNPEGYNFYLFVLAPDATSLLYGTYFGGALSQEHVDGGTSRFDKKGIVYQAVCANCRTNLTPQGVNNDDFPVTPGSWPNTGSDVNHNTQNYNCNMGVFKFDFQTAGVSADAIIFPNDTICAGDSAHFNNASSNALNYLWDFGDGSPVSTVASPIHQYALAGTYNITLIAVDSTGCLFSDTSHLNVVVAPIPTVDIGNDTVVCTDPSLILNAGTSGNIFNWSTGETTQTIVADSADNYWVTISNGTCNASDSILIQQIILVPDLGPDTSLCVGQTITLNAFEPGASYLWSTGATTSSVTISITGTYWVEVTLGPCTFSDTINVTFISYPVLSLPTEILICPDDSVLLDAGGPALEYLWSTSDTTQTITVSTQGIYSVTASNYQCAVTASVNAQQLILPILDADSTLCAGQTITLSLFFPGATYLWSNAAITSSINVNAQGTYWGTVFFSGCSQSDTMNVAYIQYPVLNMTPSVIMCQGDSAQITSGGVADNYLWSTGETTQSIIADSTGTYVVTASNQQCSTTDSTTVFEITFPPLGPDTILCAGQNIILNAFVSGASYVWSTGSTSSSINVNSPGSYWVTTTVSFCQLSDTINIGYVPYPVVNLPSTFDLCPGDTTTLDAGNTAASYLWSTGDTTQTISVSNGGTFVVIASNSQCAVTDTTLVNAIQPVSWNEENSLCDVEKYTLDAGVAASSYLWSTGETTPSIEITEAGTYWLVANSAGCILSDTINIYGGLGSGILWFPNSFTPNTDGLNDKFTAKGTEITYFHLMIFNRWGELIYDTEKMDEGWDGLYKNQLVQQDVYVWKVKYKTKCTQNLLNSRIGHVTVVR
jgi:gliding motility-associated-like protein